LLISSLTRLKASAGRKKLRITLTAEPVRERREQAAVVVTVRKNGTGILLPTTPAAD